MRFNIRFFSLLLILFIIAITTYNVRQADKEFTEINYTTFLSRLEKSEFTAIHLQSGLLTVTDIHNKKFRCFTPDVKTLLPKLEEKKLTITASSSTASSFTSFRGIVISVLMFIAVWIFFVYRQQSGRGGSSGFVKSKEITPFQRKHMVMFDDVAGVPEAKEGLVEIVQFLRNPGKYSRLGGKIPKGVLLQGPPGTGKTLLAKAIAGEADVPFFSISGSDFVEMFVGVGASRVRDLFKQAKKNAPCIIFIDEIDAVGRSRGAGGGAGGHDEREQTLNALLVEMDGFESGETVIIVAATNRPDVLDPALLRPGRFDRQVTIMPPDVVGREKILELYKAKVVMSQNVKLGELARSTPGFTGAELANLINEAALTAAKKGKNEIETIDIEEAKDKILMGAERKGMVVSDKERNTTAYHEAGHAIMALLLPGADPLHKITIIPRGRAMGVTQQVPLDDRHAYSKDYLEGRIKILLGGRTAEEIIFNKFSTGASNDLQGATEIATKMVCEWGMSTLLGPRAYSIGDEGFIGGDSVRQLYSQETEDAIDKEINSIIENCNQEAMIILEGKIDLLHSLASELIEKETLGPEEIREIVTSNLASKSGASPKERRDNIA